MDVDKFRRVQLESLRSAESYRKSTNAMWDRRLFLKFSTTLGVSFVLPRLTEAQTVARGPERPKSLVVIWLQGGASQLETWDPHPGSQVGGPTQAIGTTLPDLRIGADYPLTAPRLHHLNVIRSLTSKEGDHERASYYVRTGYRPDPTLQHPGLASLYAALTPHEGLEIPASITLGDSQWPSRGGYLGAQHDSFRVFEPGGALNNLTPRVSGEQQQVRLSGLDVLSRSFRHKRPHSHSQTQYEQLHQQAVTMMNSSQIKAFELDDESSETRQRYGDTRFGRGCLVARRLVETGVRSIEVVLEGFDTHANNFELHTRRAKELDCGLSSLLDDLIARDLWDSTMLLCISEFGRTPQINPLDGRDHWPHGFSCLVGGGGLAAGVVIGQTDPEGVKKEPTDPIPVHDLFATILTQLNLDPAEELMTPVCRPIALSQGTPIARLMTL